MNTANGKLLQGYHILVVDDEAKVAKFMTEMLKNKGCTVTTLNSSKEAMHFFVKNKQAIDLVITDQTMPEMTGAELAKILLQEKPQLPIFLVTGFSEEIDQEKAAALGIKEYITKPLRLADLAEKIKKHLPPDDLDAIGRMLAIDHEAHRLAGPRADPVGIACDLEHRHPLLLILPLIVA